MITLSAVVTLALGASALLMPTILERSGQAQSEQLGTSICTPLNVAIFVGSRIHVRCAEVQENSIQFYALSIEDPDVDRVLSMLTAAVTSGKKLFVFYNKATAANPQGCLELDCRKMETVAILPSN